MSLFGCDHGPLIAQLRAELERSEAIRAEWSRLAADADNRLEVAEQRYDALLKTVLAMKQAGATVEKAPVKLHDYDFPEHDAKILAGKPDELAALIDVQCGRDYRKRAMMLAQLKTDRAGGVDPDQIKAAIVNGVQAEGVP